MHEAFSSGQELRGQTVERPEQRRLKLLKLVCFVIVLLLFIASSPEVPGSHGGLL
jgi:hypothetical protein